MSKTKRGPFEFCWEMIAPGRQQNLPAVFAGTAFNAVLATGLYSNVTVPLVDMSIRNGVYVIIEENRKDIFQGTLDGQTVELSHKPVAGLHRLAYDLQSNSLVFLISSGKFDFQVLQVI